MLLLKLALRPWKSNLTGQLFSVFSFSFLLLLGGFLYWLYDGIEQTIHKTQTENVVVAYLSPNVKERDTAQIVDQMKLSLSAPARKSIQSFTTGDFLKDIELTYPALREQLVNLGEDIKTIVPKYLLISGTFLESDMTTLKNLKGVESIESSEHRFKSLGSTFKVVKWIVLAIGIGLFLALMGTVLQNARFNSVSNQQLIPILRQWGAGNLYMRTPAFLSGLFFGLASGVGVFVLWLMFSRSIGYQIKTFSHVLGDLALPDFQIGFNLLIVSVLFGVLSGLSSMIKTRQSEYKN